MTPPTSFGASFARPSTAPSACDGSVRSPYDLSGANIASCNLGRKAEDGAMHEKPRQDTSNDAESQSPMEVCPGDEADHIGLSNMMRRGMIETFRIPKAP